VRYVTFDPGQLDAEELDDAEKAEFRSWLELAQAAAEKAVRDYEASGTPSKETDDIWRAHKKWLLRNKFNNKCAYCEKSLLDIPRDAEHWRPKRKITDPKARDHPGYFWLAYSWRNLLPACPLCNSYGGKKNQFPISNDYVLRRKLTKAELGQLLRPAEAIQSTKEPGEWYLGAEDLDALEGPLLLHPYVDEDPTQHLQFRSNGYVAPLTKKGEWSILVFNLNRPELRQLRARADRMIRSRLLQEVEAAQNEGLDPEDSLDYAEGVVGRLLRGQGPFSVLKRAALARAVEKEREELQLGV
jgi:hypothetical protein